MPRPRTVFLDRDGVICRKAAEGDYVKNLREFAFLPRAKEALTLLTAYGYHLIVVTNQRGIARGLMTEEDLAEIHGYMARALQTAGARLDAVYHCPHEIGTCNCRKPLTGMFEQARADFPGLEFSDSCLIGDSLSDMEAGTRLGCVNILLAPVSRRAALLAEASRRAIRIAHVASSLYGAATRFLAPSGYFPATILL